MAVRAESIQNIQVLSGSGARRDERTVGQLQNGKCCGVLIARNAGFLCSPVHRLTGTNSIGDSRPFSANGIKVSERHARAIYTAVAGAQLIARTRFDIGLFEELVQSLPTVGFFLELDGEIHGLAVVETIGPGLSSVSLDDLEDAEFHGHHLKANTAARLQSINAPEEIDACCIGVDEQGAELIDTLQKGWMHV